MRHYNLMNNLFLCKKKLYDQGVRCPPSGRASLRMIFHYVYDLWEQAAVEASTVDKREASDRSRNKMETQYLLALWELGKMSLQRNRRISQSFLSN